MGDLITVANNKQASKNSDSKINNSEVTISNTVNRFNEYYLNQNSFEQIKVPGYFTSCIQSDNFLVYAKDERTAQVISNEAEKLRKSLAKEWLGYELKAWKEPLAIGVILDPSKQCSGETLYSSYNGGFQFKGSIIQGSEQRILDSVLPHELMHAILLTHLNKTPPRWADEGISTYVESKIETQKIDNNLIIYLSQGRGIPFATLFATKDYPNDMSPFYSQGYSLTKYLVELGDKKKKDEDATVLSGKQHFVKYLEKGMSDEDWVSATKEFYGFERIGKLQTAWDLSVTDSISNQSKPEEIQAEPVNPQKKETKNNNGRIKLKDDDLSELRFPSKYFKV